MTGKSSKAAPILTGWPDASVIRWFREMQQRELLPGQFHEARCGRIGPAAAGNRFFRTNLA
jgi:hypothetical protein